MTLSRDGLFRKERRGITTRRFIEGSVPGEKSLTHILGYDFLPEQYCLLFLECSNDERRRCGTCRCSELQMDFTARRPEILNGRVLHSQRQ